jgi:hypothetical protein
MVVIIVVIIVVVVLASVAAEHEIEQGDSHAWCVREGENSHIAHVGLLYCCSQSSPTSLIFPKL